MEADAPRVTVVVPARNAAETIGRTLQALAAQDLGRDFEVVVVDDGSDDDTLAIARGTPGPFTVVSDGRVGAAEARNRGVAAARGSVIAFTDADCFPAPGWLRAGLVALDGRDLVQGRVAPEYPPGPFDRTVRVDSPRGLYETANLLVTRELFERVGGFEEWLDTGREKLLAEDVWFGWRAVRAGARTGFAAEALVHHAVFPRGPRGFVGERLRLRYFPAIARRVPELRRSFYGRLFLSPRTAAFDVALAGIALGVRRRSWLPVVAAAPYARLVATGSSQYRRRAPLVLAVRVAADVVGFGALLAGSARWRSPVL